LKTWTCELNPGLFKGVVEVQGDISHVKFLRIPDPPIGWVRNLDFLSRKEDVVRNTVFLPGFFTVLRIFEERSLRDTHCNVPLKIFIFQVLTYSESDVG